MGYGCFGQACLHHQGAINTDAKNLIQMIHKRMERRHTKAKRFFVGHNLCNCVCVAESQIWKTVVYHPSLCISLNRDNIQNAHPDTFSIRPTRVRQKKRAFYWVSILMCLLLPLISGCMCV